MTEKDKWHPWVFVKWKNGAPTTAWEGWRNNPKIKGAWSWQGDWDCVLWLDVADFDALEKLVWNDIRSNAWVEATNTTWGKRWW